KAHEPKKVLQGHDKKEKTIVFR
ncbi:hypothetical protein IKE_06457, partial [Bacillus cereus VD196]